MTKYYDSTELRSKRDLQKRVPEIFICTSNRTGGKTTEFNKFAVEAVLNGKYKLGNEEYNCRKICFLYRFNYELDQCADKIFKDIGKLFFNDYNMISKKKMRGAYHELYLQRQDEEPFSIGYALALNNADTIKKMSHFFTDTDLMIFDEFQSETNNYCPNEINKFRSIHISLARGNGEQNRFLPVFMISNPVTLLNPYYTKLHIAERLQSDTHFLRGNGWVLEQGFNKSAAEAMEESLFNQAFGDDQFGQYASQGIYLNDNSAFIEKLNTGKSRYICTIKYQGKNYGIRVTEENFLYVDKRPDLSYGLRFALSTEDMTTNYQMFPILSSFTRDMKLYFDRGLCRFQDLESKGMLMQLLSY